jgi:hypothetical protein
MSTQTMEEAAAMAGCAHHHCTAILFIMAKIVRETIKVT